MLPPSSACSRRLKVTITSIRGKGSVGHASPGGGPPHKHSDLTLQPSKQIYNTPNTARRILTTHQLAPGAVADRYACVYVYIYVRYVLTYGIMMLYYDM